MDPRNTFFSELKSEECRISSYLGKIFLCGGPLGKDPRDNYYSARGYISDFIPLLKPELADHIKSAEEITDWWRDDTYEDLINFEKDIAELSNLIVIFLESAGSLAELGAFSQIKQIKEKLLVFVDGELSRENSFIQLGLIKDLENTINDSVSYYNWIEDNSSSYTPNQKHLADVANEIITEIHERFIGSTNDETLNPESTRHLFILICDIIDLMHASTIDELIDYLAGFNIKINRRRAHQYLFILEKFELIKSYSRGKKGQTFYLPYHYTERLVQYKCNTIFNRERFKDDLKAHFDANRSDEKRMRQVRVHNRIMMRESN